MSRDPVIQPIILPAAVDRNGEMIERVNRQAGVERLAKFAAGLALDRAWKIEVGEYRRKRSHEQNAYLWGCVYPTIIKFGGEQLRGWTAEDIHEYLLGEIYGWETLEGFGRKRLRPLRRSSKMSTVEFAEYVSQIQQRMAALGIYVPDPDEGGASA